MELETSLATGLDACSDNPRYDEACKRILSEKFILAWILKHTVKEYAGESIPDIASKYILGTPEISEVPVSPDETYVPRVAGTGVEDSTVTEGTVTYDIRFLAILPGESAAIKMILNVEAQNDYYPGYPIIKRAIYYCSRLISAQKDTVFTNSHYEKIRKVYSIWILTSPPKHREYTITAYSFSEKNIAGGVKEKEDYYDLASAIMICLGDSKDGTKNELIDLLNTLFSTETTKEEKKQKLEEDFEIPMTHNLEQEVDIMCNLSAGIERKGIEKGIEKGIAKGIEKGIQKGRQEGMLEAIKSLMKSMNWTAEAAMNALSLSGEEKVKYSSML